MKTCLQCNNKYPVDRSACPNCGSHDSMMSGSAEEALAFLGTLGNQSRSASTVDEGARLFQEGDLSGAKKAFKKAIEENPNNAVAHSNLGVIHQRQGHIKKAAASLEKALELDPHIEGTAEVLAEVREQLRERAERPWWRIW